MMNDFIPFILNKLKENKISKEAAFELIKRYQADPQEQSSAEGTGEIAVIGIGCRFAAAHNKEEYWANLKNGVDSVGPFPLSRRVVTDALCRATLGAEPTENSYMYGGYFDDIASFDNQVFNMSDEEAVALDPHQRIFLETSLEAVEDAGYGWRKISGTNTGIYVGNSAGGYNLFQSDADTLLDPNFAVAFVPGRVAHMFNLSGPSMMVSVGCASSLMAVHLACSGILTGDCKMALAGGVSLDIFPINSQFHIWNKLGIYKDKIRCRAFDDSAAGISKGEGCGVVVLKSLNDAIHDGDYIYAIIKGSASNHDGHSNGITAPNPVAQADVLKRAWEKAGIDPRTLSYIETHGTGTRIGDPIEFKGLTMAFDDYTKDRHFCAIGSSKTNIGHLADGGAGIAGLIKTLLSLKHKQIPPSLYFDKPNHLINFEDAPVYVNNRLAEWESDCGIRRAGVSAFGLVGTNIHVVLEEFPEAALAKRRNDKKQDSANIFCLSAATPYSLEGILRKFKSYLEMDTPYSLADICYTVNTGRGRFRHQLAILCDSREDLAQKITAILEKGVAHSGEFQGVYYSGCLKNQDSNGVLTPSNVEEIAHAYINGITIDWEAVYADGPHFRIPLPTYCFEKKVFWKNYLIHQ